VTRCRFSAPADASSVEFHRRHRRAPVQEMCLLLTLTDVVSLSPSATRKVPSVPHRSVSHVAAYKYAFFRAAAGKGAGGERRAAVASSCPHRHTFVSDSSMSHGFCHISIDVESSTHSPRRARRYTFRYSRRRFARIALFSLTRRVPLDLHSD